jgi:hypothetical protein
MGSTGKWGTGELGSFQKEGVLSASFFMCLLLVWQGAERAVKEERAGGMVVVRRMLGDLRNPGVRLCLRRERHREWNSLGFRSLLVSFLFLLCTHFPLSADLLCLLGHNLLTWDYE